MVIIGVDQSLSNSALYKHICLEIIKRIYTYDGKCDYQHQYKQIIESTMVYNPEVFTDNSPMSYGPSVPVKQPSAMKSLRQFPEKSDVKPKTNF